MSIEARLRIWRLLRARSDARGFRLLTYGGLLLQVNLEQVNSFYGTYIAGEYDFLDIHAGDVVLDAGAAWGDFSLMVARRVGTGGKVIAVEPDPILFALLARNIRLNHLEGLVVPINRAIGAREGFQTIATPHGQMAVKVQSVDQLLGNTNTDRLDAAKIDIEGFEVDAMASRSLQSARELALETHGRKWYVLVTLLLKKLGFCVSEFTNAKFIGNTLRNSSRHLDSLLRAEFASNFLATRSALGYLLGLSGAPVPTSTTSSPYRIVYARRRPG